MLWTPETIPPQVSPEASSAVSLHMLEEGVLPLAQRTLAEIQLEHEAFAAQLDELGYVLGIGAGFSRHYLQQAIAA